MYHVYFEFLLASKSRHIHLSFSAPLKVAPKTIVCPSESFLNKWPGVIFYVNKHQSLPWKERNRFFVLLPCPLLSPSSAGAQVDFRLSQCWDETCHCGSSNSWDAGGVWLDPGLQGIIVWHQSKRCILKGKSPIKLPYFYIVWSL